MDHNKKRGVWRSVGPHLAGICSGGIALTLVYVTLGSDLGASAIGNRSNLSPGVVVRPIGDNSARLLSVTADKALRGGENTTAIYNAIELCNLDLDIDFSKNGEPLALAEKEGKDLVVDSVFDSEKFSKLCEHLSDTSANYVIAHRDLAASEGNRLVPVDRADVGIVVLGSR